MKTSFEVYYTIGNVHRKTSRTYRGIGSARKDAKRIAINQLATNIHIVGFDEMAHENFREVIRCKCPTGYHDMFVECRGY